MLSQHLHALLAFIKKSASNNVTFELLLNLHSEIHEAVQQILQLTQLSEQHLCKEHSEVKI